MIIRRQVMFSDNEEETKESKRKKYKIAKAAGGVLTGVGALQTAVGHSDKIIRKVRPKNYEAFIESGLLDKQILRNNKIAGPIVAATGVGTYALARHLDKKGREEDDSIEE